MSKRRPDDAIRFHYLVDRFYFPHRTRLKAFLFSQLGREQKKIETINYIFCNDAYLLDINKQYLQHDTLTDIITFELSPPGKPLVSDVYISIDRVRENASLFNISFKHELLRVIFHGALHLSGYRDKSATDKVKMRNMEDTWLELYDVPRGMRTTKD